MKTVSSIHALIFMFILVVVMSSQVGASQIQSDLRNRMTQADYVIISPQQYVNAVSPLADFRATHNGFSTAIVTTEAIYNIFGQGIPADSAVREFITFAMTSWSNPKPQYFLLAGNVNVVPSHKEPGLAAAMEDSIMVDQWLMEGVPDTAGYFRPAAALGRFPAWDATQLQVMVNKTLFYESSNDSSWQQISLTAADYTPAVGNLFENQASIFQRLVSTTWPDTITVHLRSSSPNYRTREQFRALINVGASFVHLMGFTNWYSFSGDMYFTTWDVDSLANGNRLGLWLFSTSQRFEKEDTLAMAVSLLKSAVGGNIATLAPIGQVFFGSVTYLQSKIISEAVANPDQPIGATIKTVKRRDFPTGLDHSRIMTLFGDPALVIKNGIIAGIESDPSIPSEYALHQNYPNPFNPSTQIMFENPTTAFVDIDLYNLIGQKVSSIVHGQYPAGTHTVQLQADGLASGIYLYRMTAGKFSQVRRMILLR